MTPASSAAAELELRVDSEHNYWLGAAWLPNVTRVLEDVGLVETEYMTETARQRGRAVHIATALADQGRLDWPSISATEAHLGVPVVPYVNAWLRFKTDTGAEVLDIERRAYHPLYRFAGTRDRRLRWNGYVWVLDLKTVGTIGGAGPDWARYQTAAYDLLDPSTEPRPNKRAAILLYPDGTWKPQYHTDPNDGNYFLAFLTTFNRRKAHGLTDPIAPSH